MLAFYMLVCAILVYPFYTGPVFMKGVNAPCEETLTPLV